MSTHGVALPLALLTVVVATHLNAIDLNAVVTPPPVTVASEIDRGLEAAPDNLRIKPSDYQDAVLAIIARNKEANRATDPFLFGLYYAAWHRLWISLSLGLYPAKTERNVAAATADIYFSLARASREKLKLAEDDVKALASEYYVPDEERRFSKAVSSRKFKGSAQPVDDSLGHQVHESKANSAN